MTSLAISIVIGLVIWLVVPILVNDSFKKIRKKSHVHVLQNRGCRCHGGGCSQLYYIPLLMKTHFPIISIACIAFMVVVICCTSSGTTSHDTTSTQLTEVQNALIEDGWSIPQNSPCGELAEVYGVVPRYGQQDNYFDISIGAGCDVAVKIMESTTDKCIRYCIVPENTTITINQIPQGKYYLKLAYGKDWMEKEYQDGFINGKFTKSVVYERSVDVFDFGKKNSETLVNYKLDINVVNSELNQNFTTQEISEAEFFRN